MVSFYLAFGIKSVCLTADISPSASYLEKHPPLGFKEQPRVLAPGWVPPSSEYPHFDDAPWARAERTSMS
ncbi:hypothetical protein EC919_109210 [Pseudomonas graminis]|nr:hypothetical protein EC919_109210 [Pseudomonas graminis]